MTKEGKVLKILDEYRVVVSLGSSDVTKGDTLIVYSLGDEIKDEDKSLGRLEIIKGRLEVDYVQEKFSTAISPLISEQVLETTPSIYSSFTSSLFGSEVQRTRTHTRRNPLPLAEVPPGIDRKIRVGDLVKKEG